MCAGAVVLARIPRVVFGAWDEKAGAAGSVFDILRERRLNHWVEVYGGIREQECATLLRDFFAGHRGACNAEPLPSRLAGGVPAELSAGGGACCGCRQAVDPLLPGGR